MNSKTRFQNKTAAFHLTEIKMWYIKNLVKEIDRSIWNHPKKWKSFSTFTEMILLRRIKITRVDHTKKMK